MKKSLTILLVLVMALAAFAGCNSTTAGGSAGNRQLVIAQGSDVSALDPQLSNEIASVSVYSQIFNTLVTIDNDMNIVPCIAESWQTIDDNTVSFKIRQDIKFSDGTPLTGEDVKFTIERVINSPYVSYVLDFIDSVELTDKYTVVVHTAEPFGPMLAHFTVPYTGIVPKALVEADEAAFSKHPVGTGPYKLVEWKTGESVELAANENYFLGAPAIKSVMFKIMPENSQRLIALETGEIDIAYDISPNDISKVEAEKGLMVLNEESMACMYVGCNVKKEGPLQDLNIRKAIQCALDKQAIIDAVAYGYGSPAETVIPPKALGFSSNTPTSSFNLAKAKEYMAASAYPDGFTCTIWAYDSSVNNEACNIIQNQLAQIGITVNIEILEYSTMLSRLEDCEHDLLFERWTTDTCDAYYTLYGMYYSGSTAYEGNDAFYNNPDVDSLILEGRAKLDSAERTGVYEQIYKTICDEVPYIPVYYPYTSIAMKDTIQGFQIAPSGGHQISLVSYK